jgi:glycosyltransferase involved in cell wall biosynthesis
VADARRAGADARAILAFLIWRDSARCFGVEYLVEVDEITAALAGHLPVPVEEPFAPKPAITGVVIAKDEERIISRALRSLMGLVDELLVIDDESADATAEVAQQAGARVVRRRLGTDFAAQRNAALSHVLTPWVVMIDADETLEAGLIPLLDLAIRQPEADSVFVPRLNRIVDRGDEPVFWPDMQLKVFRSGMRYRGALHERVDGWRRPLFLPLSGPYLLHEKTRLRQHRASLLYDALDVNSPYPASLIAAIREEVRRLEETGP